MVKRIIKNGKVYATVSSKITNNEIKRLYGNDVRIMELEPDKEPKKMKMSKKKLQAKPKTSLKQKVGGVVRSSKKAYKSTKKFVKKTKAVAKKASKSKVAKKAKGVASWLVGVAAKNSDKLEESGNTKRFDPKDLMR